VKLDHRELLVQKVIRVISEQPELKDLLAYKAHGDIRGIRALKEIKVRQDLREI